MEALKADPEMKPMWAELETGSEEEIPEDIKAGQTIKLKNNSREDISGFLFGLLLFCFLQVLEVIERSGRLKGNISANFLQKRSGGFRAMTQNQKSSRLLSSRLSMALNTRLGCV